MKHQMRLDDIPFAKIKNNLKTLELRLFDEKRRKIRLGDTIEFSRRSDETQKIQAEVIGLLIYKSFADLITDISASFLGYEECEKEYLKTSMYKVYSKDDEEKYGALGIRIKLI